MNCFSSRTAWDRTPSPLAVALGRLRDSGLDWIDLTQSNPAKCGFRTLNPRLLEALANPGNLDYDPDPRGLLKTREAIAAWVEKTSGASVPPGDIFLTASSSESYTLLFRLLANPGETVLAPTPGYPLFPFLASLNDLALRHYPLRRHSGWSIDMEALETLLQREQPRVLIAVNPNNPTGQDIRGEEKKVLLEKLAARKIPLVADEVFGDFAWGAERLASFAGTSGVLTFTLGGLSKAMGLPQMKLGWILVSGPAELRREACERLEILCDTYLSANQPVQRALPSWLEHQPAVRDDIRSRLLTNLKELDRQLERQTVFRRLPASGGWYAVLEGRAVEDESFTLRLLEEKHVLVQPGYLYDMEGDGFLVISLLLQPDLFRKGIKKLTALGL